jgi:predicted tellurium resistance membrane protein TerC
MELLTIENLANLAVLIFLQAVLGFDNLLYISIESQRAPAADRVRVRRWGILIALGLRVLLLYLVMSLLSTFSTPFFEIHWEGVLEGAFTFSTIIFLLGGGFLMWTAVKEISHLLAIEHLEADSDSIQKPMLQVLSMIVLMNLIFSFDSILSALAVTQVFPVLAVAILVSGILMLVMADRVATFIERNRKYEVLGLFILMIVAVVLLGEGGHAAHLELFGAPVEAMSKTTFYFSIAVLVVVDVLQSGYQDKLATQRADAQHDAVA